MNSEFPYHDKVAVLYSYIWDIFTSEVPLNQKWREIKKRNINQISKNYFFFNNDKSKIFHDTGP